MNLIFSLAKISSSDIEAVLYLLLVFVAIIIGLAIPIVLLGLNALVSAKLSSVAKMKGHRGASAFLLCFFFGIPGYFYVAALPDFQKRQQVEKIINLLQTKVEPPEESVETEATEENVSEEQ
jgi:hypothetical protein